MTNREFLFNLDDYELAEYLVTLERYDSEGNDIWSDPSGKEYFLWNNAVESTIDWLNMEVYE